MNLYATKAALNLRLAPLVDRMATAGVAPDAVTLAALPVAVAGGACILGSPAVPALLLGVPLLAGLRLVLNLLDGSLARRTGRMHGRGELYNEVGDRLADVAFLAPAAFVPGASMPVVLVGVLIGVLASYVGVAARAAGGDRIYRGVLSKPGRMVLVGACAIAAFVAGPQAWGVFGPLLLAGTTLTLIERLVVALRRLP
jgi:phosphatidylglycerophosphate synthase